MLHNPYCNIFATFDACYKFLGRLEAKANYTMQEEGFSYDQSNFLEMVLFRFNGND